jgi:predicted nucleic acid-binding protein
MLANNQILLNVSVALTLEYEAVLKRPGLIAGFSAANVDAFLDYNFFSFDSVAIRPTAEAQFARS